MKCPRCGLIVTDQVPQCRGCGFSVDDLERHLRRQAARVPVSGAARVPARIGFVNDFAALLTEEEKTRLEEHLNTFQETCRGEIVLVTMRTAKPVKPSEYAFWLFNRWQVGGPQHTGLMILLAQAERRIECEVGYSWEPIISEVELGAVLDEVVVPLLQEGKIAEALQAGTERLTHLITSFLPLTQTSAQISTPTPAPTSLDPTSSDSAASNSTLKDEPTSKGEVN